MKKIMMAVVSALALTGCVMKPVNAVGTTHLSSWYSHGTRTASGERFNPNGLTVAHRTLPFGTLVQLTNENTGRTVVARVNDRGPFHKTRTLDVSRGVADRLGFRHKGVENLRMQVLSFNKEDYTCLIC
jgi:rare lipoprotein A